MELDMTKGNPTRHILKFMLPLLLGNLFQQFYNMVDSIVVGKYVGANALGAVGTCGSMNFLLFSLSMGLASGIGVVISQYYGGKRYEEIRFGIANSVYVLGVVSLVVSILGVLLARPILQMMQVPAETILPDATIYLQITSGGMLGVAFYNGVSSILRAIGDSRTPFIFLILSCFINIGLDLAFVILFHMGVMGVALATVIAQWISAITCILYAYWKSSYFHLKRSDWVYRGKIIASFFRLGIPIAMQSSMIAISCVALQRVVNSFGEVIMATFTITSRVEMIIQQPFSSLSMALTTYTGQNVGAGNKERVREGMKKATIMTLIFSVVMLVVMQVFGKSIAGIFVSNREVIALGGKTLGITSLFYFALGMIYAPRAIMNGYGDARFALVNGITEVACRIGLSWAFTSIPAIGYWGIWYTTCGTWVITAIACMWRYFYVIRKPGDQDKTL